MYKCPVQIFVRFCSILTLLAKSRAPRSAMRPNTQRLLISCHALLQVKYHEGTFEALRAAGAPAEGPAYADAGGLGLCFAATELVWWGRGHVRHAGCCNTL